MDWFKGKIVQLLRTHMNVREKVAPRIVIATVTAVVVTFFFWGAVPENVKATALWGNSWLLIPIEAGIVFAAVYLFLDTVFGFRHMVDDSICTENKENQYTDAAQETRPPKESVDIEKIRMTIESFCDKDRETLMQMLDSGNHSVKTQGVAQGGLLGSCLVDSTRHDEIKSNLYIYSYVLKSDVYNALLKYRDEITS